MCNRYRLTAKQVEVAATFGIRPPYEVDETFPTGDIYPTGKKTPFYGIVVVQDGDERRIERMEWGVPTQVPSKRDPATKLTKYVTNVKSLSSSFWRSMLTTPARRCLVPVTSFPNTAFNLARTAKSRFTGSTFQAALSLLSPASGVLLSEAMPMAFLRLSRTQ